MCGFVAVCRIAAGNISVSRERLDMMRDALGHRGPDDASSWASDDGRCAMGFRRLAIVNLGADGNQPMSGGKGLTVVFNGEIYNHRDLRRRLEAEGDVFRTRNSDTEVLLVGFRRWGFERLLENLVGMFAFAIWDANQGALYAARDRLGIKPIYYAALGGELVLASEIKAIAMHPAFSARMNESAFLDILNVLAAPAPDTLFDGVYKLGPGELMVCRDGRTIKRRYWSLPSPNEEDRTDPEEAQSVIREKFCDAVRLRLADEVETCLMLSGGVDSNLILSAAGEAGVKLRTFTAAFPNDPSDERAAAAATAAHFGCEHHSIEIDEQRAMTALFQLMADMDEPIADWACIPLQALSAAVAGLKIKVALVGEGADELFCGYPAWREFIDEKPFWRAVAASGPLSAAAYRALARAAPFDRLGLIGFLDVAASAASGEGRFRSGAEALRPIQAAHLLKRGTAGARRTPDPAESVTPPAGLAERLEDLSDGPTSSAISGGLRFARMRARDLKFRLPELLLMRVDKITMGSSVEARVPFLDHRLVEYVCRLAPDLVLAGGGGKPLLKRACADLAPPGVFDRPKIGLGAPMSKWMRGGLRNDIAELLNAEARDPDSPFDGKKILRLFDRHASGEKEYASYLSPIVNLALWRRKWLA